MQAVALEGLPDAIDISTTFRRPIFWDDMLALYWRGDQDLLLVKNDGILSATGRIAAIKR